MRVTHSYSNEYLSSLRENQKTERMAAPQGFEPRQNEPESLVLPLHHGAS